MFPAAVARDPGDDVIPIGEPDDGDFADDEDDDEVDEDDDEVDEDDDEGIDVD
ncbi:MAG: hypothetical protein U1F10_01855 [Burkholderiales bacterium]